MISRPTGRTMPRPTDDRDDRADDRDRTVLSDLDFSDAGARARGARFTHPPESRPLDGYTVKRAIHRGGFGEVYYGLSDGGKEVAMKLLHQHTDVELRGANACLNLNHPNLVTIYDIRRDAGGDWWVLMEYAGGPRLADVIEDRGKLPVEEIEHWLRGMTAGLSFLHERGLVHRDLKPANIFAEGGTVKVGDVGLSKFISESRGSEHTRSVGTVYYMAPEVANGRYGRGVDIYALAVMLFEMYTGKVPFDGESPAEILMKHLSAPPDLSPLPPALKPVFARALHKDPDKRTRSAAALEREFRAAVRGQGGGEMPADPFAGAAAGRSVPVQTAAVQTPAPDADRVYDRLRREERARRRSAKAAEKAEDGFLTAIKWTAFAVVLVAIFSPRALRGLTSSIWELAILGALGYGVYRVVKWLAGPHDISSSSSPPPPAGPRYDRERERDAPRQNVQVRYVPPPKPSYRRRPVPLGPEDDRAIPAWRRVTEFSGSAAVAGLLSAAVAGLMILTGAVSDAPAAALFGLVTAVASWGALALSKAYEGRVPKDWFAGRPGLVILGAAVGLAAWGADRFLLVGVPVERDSILSELGARGPLPYWGWVGFFTTLFGLRRWWRHADGYRPKRLRIRSVLLTAAVGLGAGLVWGVPPELGLPWAVGVSVVTQLSAVWTPGRKRPHKVPVTA